MKNLIFLIGSLFISHSITVAQIKVWANGSVSAGTVITNSDPTNPNGQFNKVFIDGGTIRGLYVRTQHTFDWFQSVTVGLTRVNTVSYVVNYNGSDKFFVHGSGYVWSNGIYLGSDVKLKENIRPLENSLERILKLRGVWYNIKDEVPVNKDMIVEHDSTTYIGFIAQEVEKVVPEVVKENYNGIKGISYPVLTSLLVEGIKEQQLQIDQLREEVTQMKAQLNLSSNSDSKLYQNKPNPFNNVTTIEYELGVNVRSAEIYVYDLNGTQKSSYILGSTSGKSNLQINAKSLTPGMYLYSLIVDGVEIDTKKMIITD